jgi:hypothetical protein
MKTNNNNMKINTQFSLLLVYKSISFFSSYLCSGVELLPTAGYRQRIYEKAEPDEANI